jgi:hypothetical protein
MPWREAFLTRFGVGAFGGITLGYWLRVLRENHFAIDLPYWVRAATITLASIQNTALGVCENLRFARRVRRTRIAAPLFILGIWRSGTTHLQNLFAQDDRFAYPNFCQVVYPHSFLSTERTHARFLRVFLPEQRLQDNVKLGVLEPQEEEYALCSLIGRSLLLSLAFPRRAERYDRYVTLRGLSSDELTEWKSALTWFLKKLSFKYGRPLVLKSPGHTCRISLLLELFPDAKFVHVHRNPYAVFQSTRHAVLRISPLIALQRPDYSNLNDRTLRQYQEVYDAFFQERGLIPKGHFHEVSFEGLEADPIGQVRGIYEALALPDFGHVEPALRAYHNTLAGYRKNTLPDLPADLRSRIATQWRRCFDEWGYPV